MHHGMGSFVRGAVLPQGLGVLPVLGIVPSGLSIHDAAQGPAQGAVGPNGPLNCDVSRVHVGVREDDLVSTTGGIVRESQQLAEGCLVNKGSNGPAVLDTGVHDRLTHRVGEGGFGVCWAGDASKLGQVVLELGGDVVDILV